MCVRLCLGRWCDCALRCRRWVLCHPTHCFSNFSLLSLPIPLPYPRLLISSPGHLRCPSRRRPLALCPGDGPRAAVPERHGVQARLGWAQTRHHQLRQLRLRHADCVPVHHHGGLDRRPLLGGSGPEPAGCPYPWALAVGGPVSPGPLEGPLLPLPLPGECPSIPGGGAEVPPVSTAPGAVRMETRSLAASVSAPTLSPRLAMSDSPLMARNLRFPEGGRAL